MCRVNLCIECSLLPVAWTFPGLFQPAALSCGRLRWGKRRIPFHSLARVTPLCLRALTPIFRIGVLRAGLELQLRPHAESLTGVRMSPRPCLVMYWVPRRRRHSLQLRLLLALPVWPLLGVAWCVGFTATRRIVLFVHFPWPSQYMWAILTNLNFARFVLIRRLGLLLLRAGVQLSSTALAGSRLCCLTLMCQDRWCIECSMLPAARTLPGRFQQSARCRRLASRATHRCRDVCRQFLPLPLWLP